MPTKCSVSRCENYYSRGVPFFDIPSPLKYKFSSEKTNLSKKRRKLWLDAMGIKNDSYEILRICSKHFVSGKPAPLEHSRDVDWVPTLHMTLSASEHKKHRKQNEDSKTRRDSNRSTRSSKESVGKNNESSEKHKHGKTERNIRKKESTKIAKKVDLKKFLNCKVLLDGNVQCSTFKGTNGSGLTITQKHGDFTSDNVTVKETTLNDTVLRVRLIREDLDDLKRKYKLYTSPNRKKRKDQRISSFGRQIKKKIHFFEESFIRTSLKKSDNKNSESLKNSTPTTRSWKSENQMRSRSYKEDKIVTSEVKPSREISKIDSDISSKTLNRSIKKSYRDKIKIRLFPKTSSSIRKAINHGTGNLSTDEALQMQRKILFVRKYKTEHQRFTLGKNYFLKFNPYCSPEDGVLEYSFQKLVTDVKHMKLPAPCWKIKVIIRQGKIAAITFTNKLALERSVGFTANNDVFKITIDNKPALLLGSPNRVRTSEDLEILLDIVENIEASNPMIFYK